jgi:16S rRNA (guanine966-N2)-methyltransferase
MRIISGILKGRSINFLKNSKTRPLKDNIKENIFNILKHSNYINVNIEDSNILDLYSGVGSFGIECFSRGAKKITFIEQDEDAAKILEKNLIKLSIEKKAKIHINKIENVLNENLKEKFHIIFLDPPFSDIKFLHNLKIIKNKKIFTKNHIIIIHREERSNENIEDLLITIEVKHYGRSKIIFGVFK